MNATSSSLSYDVITFLELIYTSHSRVLQKVKDLV